MLFNSIEFAIFLPIVFILYWFVFNKQLRLQNLFIVFVSYIFYGWWDWRFLILIAFTTLCSWFSGVLIEKIRLKQETNTKRINWAKIISTSNIILNLGILGVYKYFNFFVASFVEAFASINIHLEPTTLYLILPVGISFYTFQALSYSIDVYRKQLNATNDIVSFFAYISFFPQLVAGPIERATNLLPQFYKKRTFDYEKSIDGMRQILWGLFKKVVIADNCAQYANTIFDNYNDYNGSTLFIGAIFFAIQIYGDFSGYSDIAIGTARLFGFNLMKNFAFPYFSRDIAEFWRRWHISLSTWFRDYLYIPLGGSRGGKWLSIRNTLIIFTVSGFWHGANWTFIIWGLLNALFIFPSILLKTNRINLEIVAKGKWLPSISDLYKIATTFILVSLAWIFFRSESVFQSYIIIKEIFSISFFTIPEITGDRFLKIAVLIFFLIEWIGRESEFAIHKNVFLKNSITRWIFYVILSISILYFIGEEQQFIYFQF